ncbi:Low-density lipoprotein receptor-related protein 1B [Anabarilius grahami]|uniref:Low-density lipoprotein receptor-related protein 1B n=1 Tax=Anabarilius grahami TaxID=495550 RepID=A0A3N0Y821_ANAGA|nr:Low-density lipoprotein receptor-related protein 1B [Anabarilius grahami]
MSQSSLLVEVAACVRNEAHNSMPVQAPLNISYCYEPILCDVGEFLCGDQLTCVSENWLCDGEPDCPDGSDEVLDKSIQVLKVLQRIFSSTEKPKTVTEFLKGARACYSCLVTKTLHAAPVECGKLLEKVTSLTRNVMAVIDKPEGQSFTRLADVFKALPRPQMMYINIIPFSAPNE